MSEHVQITHDRLADLRTITEAATDAIERALFNNNPDAARNAEHGLRVLLDTLATQADEIERLRRERGSLAEIVIVALDFVRRRNGYRSDNYSDLEGELIALGLNTEAEPGLEKAREDVADAIRTEGRSGRCWRLHEMIDKELERRHEVRSLRLREQEAPR